MADTAWLLVHSYDAETQALTEAALQEQDISRIHPFTPEPGSWLASLGIRSEVHLINGSIIHLTETFAALVAALKAKSV